VCVSPPHDTQEPPGDVFKRGVPHLHEVQQHLRRQFRLPETEHFCAVRGRVRGNVLVQLGHCKLLYLAASLGLALAHSRQHLDDQSYGLC
jgi:hypothetical protein